MEDKRYLKLNDISSYKIAFLLSNYVWNIVLKWNIFCKNTIGGQFIRAVDSISANIAEGFGRNGKRDKIKFYYYAMGSTKEALDWNEKCKIRNLITEEGYKTIFEKLSVLPKEINILIKFTNEKLAIQQYNNSTI
jgi:four helix bundle protein